MRRLYFFMRSQIMRLHPGKTLTSNVGTEPNNFLVLPGCRDILAKN